jgi:NAD(P)H-dependent flavin oxidoreductase YrpB (nitropropane dioxygenase family)
LFLLGKRSFKLKSLAFVGEFSLTNYEIEYQRSAVRFEIIVQSPETDTALVDFERFQVRALHTPLVEKLIQADQMDTGLFGGKAMEDSWLKGDAEAGILPAGQISGLIGGVLSVREIIEEMVGKKTGQNGGY